MSDMSPSLTLLIAAASQAGAQELRREQKGYLAVYAALMVGTTLTVAMYYVHFDALWQTVTVALVIAAAKAACVSAVFMHLWHGQRDVYRLLCFTGVFVVTLFALTIYSLFSLPGSGHYLR